MHGPKPVWLRAVYLILRPYSGWLLLTVGLLLTMSTTGSDPRLQAQTATPTATLRAPSNGAVVATTNLSVYSGPGDEFELFGNLPYGAFIFPDVQAPGGEWVRIGFAGLDGWIDSAAVTWAYNFRTLPVLDLESTPEQLATPTVVTATPEDTSTLVPSPTNPSTTTPQSSETPQLAATTPARPTSLALLSDEDPDALARSAPVVLPTQLLLILAAVLGAFLSIRFLMSQRKSERHIESGFIIETCPACRTGKLTLQDMGRGRRVVRCDNCRSVLRQLRGNRWRYAVDSVPDPQFAESHNSEVLSEGDLLELSRQRSDKL